VSGQFCYAIAKYIYNVPIYNMYSCIYIIRIWSTWRNTSRWRILVREGETCW